MRTEHITTAPAITSTGKARNDNAQNNTFAALLNAVKNSDNITTTGSPQVIQATAPAESKNLLDTSELLLPTLENIQMLLNKAANQLKPLLKEAGITAPESITYDRNGQMVLPKDYPYKEEFTKLITENEELGRTLHNANALSSMYAEIQKSLAFQEEYSQAQTQAEINAVIDKYSFLFNSNRQYSQVALTFSQAGDITVQIDGTDLLKSSS